MSKAYILLADGFEEVEAFTPVDLMRRAGVEVVCASITDKKEVTGARKINALADITIDEVGDDGDMLILPGGMPGTNYLKESSKVQALVRKYNETGKYLAAICAAPTVFGAMGLLSGKKATCYPGMEDGLTGAEWTGEDVNVAVDGRFITSRGVGTAIDFSLSLIEILVSKEKADNIANAVVYKR